MQLFALLNVIAAVCVNARKPMVGAGFSHMKVDGPSVSLAVSKVGLLNMGECARMAYRLNYTIFELTSKGDEGECLGINPRRLPAQTKIMQETVLSKCKDGDKYCLGSQDWDIHPDMQPKKVKYVSAFFDTEARSVEDCYDDVLRYNWQTAFDKPPEARGFLWVNHPSKGPSCRALEKVENIIPITHTAVGFIGKYGADIPKNVTCEDFTEFYGEQMMRQCKNWDYWVPKIWLHGWE